MLQKCRNVKCYFYVKFYCKWYIQKFSVAEIIIIFFLRKHFLLSYYLFFLNIIYYFLELIFAFFGICLAFFKPYEK